tara:strand:+ start:152 stop:2566 length:2415 start_codon:yes stop_codon:yes gene_type:complete
MAGLSLLAQLIKKGREAPAAVTGDVTAPNVNQTSLAPLSITSIENRLLSGETFSKKEVEKILQDVPPERRERIREALAEEIFPDKSQKIKGEASRFDSPNRQLGPTYKTPLDKEGNRVPPKMEDLEVGGATRRKPIPTKEEADILADESPTGFRPSGNEIMGVADANRNAQHLAWLESKLDDTAKNFDVETGTPNLSVQALDKEGKINPQSRADSYATEIKEILDAQTIPRDKAGNIIPRTKKLDVDAELEQQFLYGDTIPSNRPTGTIKRTIIDEKGDPKDVFESAHSALPLPTIKSKIKGKELTTKEKEIIDDLVEPNKNPSGIVGMLRSRTVDPNARLYEGVPQSSGKGVDKQTLVMRSQLPEWHPEYRPASVREEFPQPTREQQLKLFEETQPTNVRGQGKPVNKYLEEQTKPTLPLNPKNNYVFDSRGEIAVIEPRKKFPHEETVKGYKVKEDAMSTRSEDAKSAAEAERIQKLLIDKKKKPETMIVTPQGTAMPKSAQIDAERLARQSVTHADINAEIQDVMTLFKEKMAGGVDKGRGMFTEDILTRSTEGAGSKLRDLHKRLSTLAAGARGGDAAALEWVRTFGDFLARSPNAPMTPKMRAFITKLNKPRKDGGLDLGIDLNTGQSELFPDVTRLNKSKGRPATREERAETAGEGTGGYATGGRASDTVVNEKATGQYSADEGGVPLDDVIVDPRPLPDANVKLIDDIGRNVNINRTQNELTRQRLVDAQQGPIKGGKTFSHLRKPTEFDPSASAQRRGPENSQALIDMLQGIRDPNANSETAQQLIKVLNEILQGK